MKRITLLFLAFNMVFHLSAQQPINEPASFEVDYLKKGKSQSAGGGLLLVAGVIGLAATLVSDVGQSMSGLFVTAVSLGTATPKYKSHTVPYLLSASALVGGIVLLAEGSKNRRKAKLAQVYIDMEKSKVVKLTGLENTTFPVVGLKIRL